MTLAVHQPRIPTAHIPTRRIAARFSAALWILFLGMALTSCIRAEAAGQIAAAQKTVLQETPPPTAPLPLDQYWRLVERTHNLAEQAETTSDDTVHASFQDIAAEWAAIEAIQIPISDQTITVPLDTRAIVTELRSDSPQPSRLKNLLSSQLAQRAQWPENRQTPEELRELRDILAQNEFQWQTSKPAPWQKWLQDLLDKISKFLDQLSGNSQVRLSASLLNYLLFGLGALILAAVLAFTWINVRRFLVAEITLEAAGNIEEENLTADTAMQKAQDLSADGDYRQAVRYLYLSALLLLDEHGLLRYDRSRTNREYLHSVAHLPAIANDLHFVVEVFDRVWYGYQPLEQADFEHYAEQVARLRQQREQK